MKHYKYKHSDYLEVLNKKAKDSAPEKLTYEYMKADLEIISSPPAANSENGQIRTVSITHPTDNGAQEAVTMITAILASKKQNDAAAAPSGPQVTIQVMVSNQKSTE